MNSFVTEKNHPLVSIIIPVFNKVTLTRRCVESILKAPPSISFEIVIVDDHSQDGTRDYLAYLSRRYNFVKTRSNSRNMGFSASCNRGAEIAKGKFLIFLNNHTVTLPGWVEALVEVAERDRNIAVVGAKLLYPNNTIQHAGVLFRNFPFPVTPFHVYAGEPADYPEANVELDYDAVTAACMLVKRKIFEKLGGFDERFVNGYEDVDFCLRVKDAGYRIVYTPRSVVYHLESSSHGRFDRSIPNIRILHNKWMGKVRYILKREPKVSIVIVNYNGWSDTVETIASIFSRERYERFNIIVIDNGSYEDRSEEIENLCHMANRSFSRIISEIPSSVSFNGGVFSKRLHTNKGFGGGSNEGIKIALQWGADYVWLLNNDTIIGDLAMYFLVSAAEYLPRVAIVGSKLHCYPETEKIQFNGVSVSYRGVSARSRKPEKILSVPFVSGASMLIRSNFLKKYGLLREDYFLYFEDNEICLRANREGFIVLYNPLSVVYHKGGASIGDFMESPLSIYYGIRNSLFYYKEWNERGIEETFSLIEKALLPRIISENNKAKLEALLQAINDFIIDKKGSRIENIRSIANTNSRWVGLYNRLYHLSQLVMKDTNNRRVIEAYLDMVRTLSSIKSKC